MASSTKSAKKQQPRKRSAAPHPLRSGEGLPEPDDDAEAVREHTGNGADDRYAPSVWSTAGGTSVGEDLECPSGQLALVKRPGVQGLIEAGILDKLDSLTALVDNKHIKRVKGKPESIDVKGLMKDTKNLTEVLAVVDQVVVHCVIKPQLTLAWYDGRNEDGKSERIMLSTEEREQLESQTGRKHIFTDMVDLTDKMFIFNYAVGGTRSLERFREQTGGLLDGMDLEQDMEVQAE